MAAVWGRLVKFSRSTSSSLPRFSRCFSSLVRYQIRGRPAAPLASCQDSYVVRRWISTDDWPYSTSEEREKTRQWVAEAKKRSWLWQWLHDVHEIERVLMSEEEFRERELLLQKVWMEKLAVVK